MRAKLAISPFTVLLLSAAVRPAGAQAVTVVRNVTVIDGTGAPARGGMDVTIRRGRIARIAPAAASAAGPRVEMIDGTGKFLLPGFIDTHVHAAAGPFVLDSSGPRPRARMVYDDSVAIQVLDALLRFGITSVRVPGGPTAAAVALERRVAAGEIPGPRIVTAGNLIDTSPFPGLTTVVGTEAEVRAEVDRQARAGVDFVKLYAGLGPALVRAGIEEAHARGIEAVGHLGATSWTEAARFGIDGVVHIIAGSADLLPPDRRAEYRAVRGPGSLIAWLELLDPGAPQIDTMITEMVRHRVSLDPTLVTFDVAFHRDDPRYTTENPDLGYAPKAMRKAWVWMSAAAGFTPQDYTRARSTWPKAEELVRALYRRGVLLTVGTDAPNPWIIPGAAFHQELGLLVRAGIPAAEVLVMATRNGARALGIERDVGTIAVGKRADLVLLEANPIDDIANSRRIVWVMRGGTVLAR